MTAAVSRFTDLKEYLDAVTRAMPETWTVLRAMGGFRDIRTFSSEELAFIRAVTDEERLRPKNCFGNAQTLVLLHPTTLKYVQGYVWSPGVAIPVEHAWVEYEGAVVEATLRPDPGHWTEKQKKDWNLRLRRLNRIRPYLQPEPGAAYWGFEVSPEIISKVWLTEHVARSLTDVAYEALVTTEESAVMSKPTEERSASGCSSSTTAPLGVRARGGAGPHAPHVTGGN